MMLLNVILGAVLVTLSVELKICTPISEYLVVH
jgi:hypothetical protein